MLINLETYLIGIFSRYNFFLYVNCNYHIIKVMNFSFEIEFKTICMNNIRILKERVCKVKT